MSQKIFQSPTWGVSVSLCKEKGTAIAVDRRTGGDVRRGISSMGEGLKHTVQDGDGRGGDLHVERWSVGWLIPVEVYKTA